ncbi:MAG: hypothetical protein ACYDDB_01235 [bacterium]
MNRDDILSELEDPSPEGQGQDFREKDERETAGKKPKKNKKLVYAVIGIITLSAAGLLAYKYLLKTYNKPLLPKGALLFTPPVSSPAVSDLPAKPAGIESVPGVIPAKAKPLTIKEPAAAKKGSNLNDLFAIKYKKPAKKILTILPGQMPINNFPQAQAYNAGVNLPSFDAIKNKLKNINKKTAKSSFTVLGASGSYVVVQCAGADDYLKIGDSACGRTLLGISASKAEFSRNGKIKSYAY